VLGFFTEEKVVGVGAGIFYRREYFWSRMLAFSTEEKVVGVMGT